MLKPPRRPSRLSRSSGSRTTRRSRLLSFVAATTLVAVVAGCGPKRTQIILPTPPDLPPAAFDELVTGSCPRTLDWYWEDYEPWLEKLEEARDAVE